MDHRLHSNLIAAHQASASVVLIRRNVEKLAVIGSFCGNGDGGSSSLELQGSITRTERAFTQQALSAQDLQVSVRSSPSSKSG